MLRSCLALSPVRCQRGLRLCRLACRLKCREIWNFAWSGWDQVGDKVGQSYRLIMLRNGLAWQLMLWPKGTPALLQSITMSIPCYMYMTCILSVFSSHVLFHVSIQLWSTFGSQAIRRAKSFPLRNVVYVDTVAMFTNLNSILENESNNPIPHYQNPSKSTDSAAASWWWCSMAAPETHKAIENALSMLARRVERLLKLMRVVHSIPARRFCFCSLCAFN